MGKHEAKQMPHLTFFLPEAQAERLDAIIAAHPLIETRSQVIRYGLDLALKRLGEEVAHQGVKS